MEEKRENQNKEEDGMEKLLVAIIIAGAAVGAYLYYKKTSELKQKDLEKESLKTKIEEYFKKYGEAAKHSFAHFLCARLDDLSEEHEKEILEKKFPKLENFKNPWLDKEGKKVLVEFARERYGLELDPSKKLIDLMEPIEEAVKREVWEEVVEEISKYPLSEEDRKTLEKYRNNPQTHLY